MTLTRIYQRNKLMPYKSWQHFVNYKVDLTKFYLFVTYLPKYKYLSMYVAWIAGIVHRRFVTSS